MNTTAYAYQPFILNVNMFGDNRDAFNVVKYREVWDTEAF